MPYSSANMVVITVEGMAASSMASRASTPVTLNTSTVATIAIVSPLPPNIQG